MTDTASNKWTETNRYCVLHGALHKPTIAIGWIATQNSLLKSISHLSIPVINYLNLYLELPFSGIRVEFSLPELFSRNSCCIRMPKFKNWIWNFHGCDWSKFGYTRRWLVYFRNHNRGEWAPSKPYSKFVPNSFQICSKFVPISFHIWKYLE